MKLESVEIIPDEGVLIIKGSEADLAVLFDHLHPYVEQP